jgi:hypothetical protein
LRTKAIVGSAVVAVIILGFLIYFPNLRSGIGEGIVSGQSTLSVATSSTATSNSSLELRLELQLSTNSTGSLTVRVNEVNMLDVSNNVTAANSWRYTPAIVNAYSGCGGVAIYQSWTSIFEGPAIFAVFRGYYDVNNYTIGQPLTLYNTTYMATGCPGYPVHNYIYAPMSARGISLTVRGYWTGGQDRGGPATFNQFSPGTYTVVAMDTWGRVVLLHFMANKVVF